MIKKELVDSVADRYYDTIIGIRRKLHAYPELSKHEKQTSELICYYLDKLHIEYNNDIYGYGIVAKIEGKNPDKYTIALRADMDALPITEETSLPFASKNKGVMHACGHDIHMSSLLGAIHILNELKDSFEGRILFVFQPSEEEYPGGAISMINNGIFNEIKPNNMLAFHCTPELECGMIAIKEGKIMASTDEIYIKVIGRGGHGATPHLDIDPVVAACHVVIALQTIVSRNANPTMPTTFSVGRFIANGRTNIIPNEVNMDCIIRTFDEQWRKQCHELINRIAKSTAEAFGCTAEVFIDPGYPFVYNEPNFTKQITSIAQEYLGPNKVISAQMRMTAEDFAYFAQVIPSCYFRLGTKIESEPIHNLHTSLFNANEESIRYAMGLEAYLAIKCLEQNCI